METETQPSNRVQATGVAGKPPRRGWKIAAGIIAPVEAALALGVWALVAPLYAPTARDQVPMAIGFSLAAAAFVVTAVAVWCSSRGPVARIGVIVAWLSHLYAIADLLNEGGLSALHFVAAVVLLFAVVIVGTVPLLRRSRA